MKPTLNLLVDLDGTLTDPREGITRSIAHALQSLGHEPPPEEELLFAIGPPLRGSFAHLLRTDDHATIEQAMKYYRDRFGTVGLLENQVYPGIPEMLQALRESGARLFLATAKPHVYATQILDHFKLSAYFEFVYGSELDGTRQHKAALLKHLLEIEQIDPACTTMIGDRIHDFDAARANGCDSLGVGWGYGSATELAAARQQCNSPAQVISTLLNR